MEGVAIVGGGQTNYGDFPDLSIKEMFALAYREMLKSVDKGIEPDAIETAYVGTVGSGGFQLGQAAPLLTGYVGLPNIPAVRVENACASGGFALLEAIQAIVSGRYQVVLAAGIEKMRDVSAGKTKYWLGISGDTEYERLAGLTFAGIYATIARRYMEEYGMKKEHLSMVAVKNHRHGVQNPKAQFRREIDLETAMKAPNVAYPLNLFDCCSTTDGAALVLLANTRIARRFTDIPVEIIGYGAASDHLAIQDRESITGLLAASEAARQAYSQAGVSPREIDFAEVHDCFTIAEILAYEDLGFCPRGHGYKILEEGQTSLGGRIPVNVSGGLKSKGHPLGATGIGQAYEVFKQLRGQADKPGRQVPNAEIALTHNVGGSGGTAVVCVYRRRGN